ncbi:MAG: hypothetical protein FJX77_16925 [Armatimonadetes bacterium]|nr:hypothetical protein [Armatimonadota bacterium]
MRRKPAPHKAVDIDLKQFFNHLPHLAWRLAGVEVAPGAIRLADATIVVRELHPDRFPVWEDPEQGPEGLLVEIFMDPPSREDLLACFIKALQASADHKMPVSLLLVYLRKGDRATFPDQVELSRRSELSTGCYCRKVHLWEEREAVLNGPLLPLAGVLLLGEPAVGEVEVAETLAALNAGDLDAVEYREGAALLFLVGLRSLTEAVMQRLFRGRMNEVMQSTTIQGWIDEARLEERLAERRWMILRQGTARFGDPDPRSRRTVERIEDPERLAELIDRLVQAGSWKELLA